MKGLLVFDILNHLYENDVINENQIDITDFILSIKKNSGDKIEQHNVNRINKAVELIRGKKYAGLFFQQDGTGTPFMEMETDRINSSLSLSGYDYVVKERRKKERDELNKTTREYTAVQKNVSIKMLWTTVVIAIATAVNVLILLSKTQQTTLQLSPQIEQLLDHNLIMDSIAIKDQLRFDSLLVRQLDTAAINRYIDHDLLKKQSNNSKNPHRK